jgi:hypothetical protein
MTKSLGFGLTTGIFVGFGVNGFFLPKECNNHVKFVCKTAEYLKHIFLTG